MICVISRFQSSDISPSLSLSLKLFCLSSSHIREDERQKIFDRIRRLRKKFLLIRYLRLIIKIKILHIFMTKLGEILDKKNMSSYELALKIKVHPNMVRKFVRGLTVPSLENAVMISKELSIPIETIFSDIIQSYAKERGLKTRKFHPPKAHGSKKRSIQNNATELPYISSF